MTMTQWELSEKDLRARFIPEALPFETTRDLVPCEEVIGQERAVRAIDFGLGMSDPSYNIFVAGSPGTGRNSIVKTMVQRVAEKLPVPDDWVYVNNFKIPDRPIAIPLSRGKGRQFQRDMSRLIQFLKSELTKVIQSQEYQDKRRNLEEEMSKSRDVLTNELDMRAREYGFLIENSPLGIMIVPLLRGKPIKAEEMEALSPDVRAEIQRKEKELHEHIHTYVRRVRILREEADQKIEALGRQVAEFASRQAFEALYSHYEDFPKVLDHIHSVQADILENIKDFLSEEKPAQLLPGLEGRQNHFATNRYAVNVVVDNSGMKGAPLVMETNPTYNNLVGQIEKRSLFGAFYTDFTMIKAGSLLHANGGFLLVNVLDLLRNPFSWDALKRIIRNRELKIEDIAELYGLSGASGIKPEPIPVKVRVVLLGSPMIYYLLQAYDDDFGKIFKVKADFDVQQARKDDSSTEYGRFIAKVCKDEGLRHFDRTGAAAALDEIGRWVGHQKKLSLRFSDLADLVREASFWAGKEGAELVSARHVDKAIAEKIHRSNLLEDYIQEMITEGTLMVEVKGSVAGQVNGLSVYEMGDFAFGKPSRITARTFMGEGGVVNIEREAKLSGKTHNKGVLILSGYLGGRYAMENPLSLAATLAFEQSYGEIDGDSASGAELAAILSSISGIPVRQEVAMTGSVNQMGEIQAIGGVNEKIEGFFSVCKALGLTGSQGVIIPKANVKHLMLRGEVVQAVSERKFHIYAIANIDEALEILTGVPAGALQPDGKFSAGSVNETVRERLSVMAEKLKAENVKENKEEEENVASVSSSSPKG